MWQYTGKFLNLELQLLQSEYAKSTIQLCYKIILIFISIYHTSEYCFFVHSDWFTRRWLAKHYSPPLQWIIIIVNCYFLVAYFPYLWCKQWCSFFLSLWNVVDKNKWVNIVFWVGVEYIGHCFSNKLSLVAGNLVVAGTSKGLEIMALIHSCMWTNLEWLYNVNNT